MHLNYHLGVCPPNGHSPSKKSLILLWGHEFNHWDSQNMLIFNIFPNSKLKRFAFIYLFFIYDRNSNLNSHTHIFWRSRGLNPHPHRRVGLFGDGDYYYAEYPSSRDLHIYIYITRCFILWSKTAQKGKYKLNVSQAFQNDVVLKIH